MRRNRPQRLVPQGAGTTAAPYHYPARRCWAGKTAGRSAGRGNCVSDAPKARVAVRVESCPPPICRCGTAAVLPAEVPTTVLRCSRLLGKGRSGNKGSRHGRVGARERGQGATPGGKGGGIGAGLPRKMKQVKQPFRGSLRSDRRAACAPPRRAARGRKPWLRDLSPAVRQRTRPHSVCDERSVKAKCAPHGAGSPPAAAASPLRRPRPGARARRVEARVQARADATELAGSEARPTPCRGREVATRRLAGGDCPGTPGPAGKSRSPTRKPALIMMADSPSPAAVPAVRIFMRNEDPRLDIRAVSLILRPCVMAAGCPQFLRCGEPRIDHSTSPPGEIVKSS